jgi:hypothetical protein
VDLLSLSSFRWDHELDGLGEGGLENLPAGFIGEELIEGGFIELAGVGDVLDGGLVGIGESSGGGEVVDGQIKGVGLELAFELSAGGGITDADALEQFGDGFHDGLLI